VGRECKRDSSISGRVLRWAVRKGRRGCGCKGLGDGGEVGEEGLSVGILATPTGQVLVLRAMPLATWLSQSSSYYGLLVHWSTHNQRQSLHSVTVGKV